VNKRKDRGGLHPDQVGGRAAPSPSPFLHSSRTVRIMGMLGYSPFLLKASRSTRRELECFGAVGDKGCSGVSDTLGKQEVA